jgi:hypothetical protein
VQTVTGLVRTVSISAGHRGYHAVGAFTSNAELRRSREREVFDRMQRPIGVTLLAVGAGLAGLYQVWRILVFAGIANFTFIGQPVQFNEPQWGYIFWSAILALIWFWVAAGF